MFVSRKTDAEQFVNVAVKSVVKLAGHLVDAVDVDRAETVPLVDRQLFRPTINLTGAGEDHRAFAG